MEYTALIDRILEAERAANAVTDEAREELAGLNDHLMVESQRIRDNLMRGQRSAWKSSSRRSWLRESGPLRPRMPG